MRITSIQGKVTEGDKVYIKVGTPYEPAVYKGDVKQLDIYGLWVDEHTEDGIIDYISFDAIVEWAIE